MRTDSGSGNERLIHFGAALGAALGLLALLKPAHGPVLLGCATALLAVAVTLPGVLRLPYRGMNLAALTVGKGLTLALLTVFFYLIISPLALARRLAAGGARPGGKAGRGTSRWMIRRGDAVKPSDLEKQF